MDLPSQEVEIPMPLNSVYAGGAHVHDHHHHHHHHHEASATQFPALPASNGQNHENHHKQHEQVVLASSKKQQQVRYRECQKNHAAAMGGNATDGCGEFMPSGEEGSIEALTCSACNCHRNFHRKEVEGELIPLMSTSPPPLVYDGAAGSHHHLMLNSRGRKVINLGHHKNMLSPSEAYGGYPPAATAGALLPAGGGSRSVPIIPYSVGPLFIPSDDQSDDQEDAGNPASAGVACRSFPPPPPPPHQQHQYYIHHHSNHHHHHHNQMLKKRFRTKFTPEQKEKMLSFAEKVGWKIQKQEESVVQQLCQEIGVKRRVLKVWMHNNKHNLAKKNSSTSNAQQQQQQL